MIPSSNTTMEEEFWRFLPRGFSVHVARLKLRNVNVEELSLMESYIDDEVLKLVDADIDIIVYGCTTGSLFKGFGHDKVIEEKIEKISGKPAISTSGAVIKALKILGVRNISIATPYIDELNNLERKFFIDNGFNVLDLKSLNILRNIDIGRVSSNVVIDLVLKLNYSLSDAIFISCTNLPTLNLIDYLENIVGKPVVSSNSATLWAVLNKLNCKIDVYGYGKLLSLLRG